MLAILMVAGALCFGITALLAERSRAHAAAAVRAQTEPLLVQTMNLYTALTDANATATTTFLRGGLEPPALRARYVQDLRLATASLGALIRGIGDDAGTRAAVATIDRQLPVYSGLVEAARANNRQGFPVGAAYLRQASGLLTGALLPGADRLYASEARALSGNYATGTAAAALSALAIVVVVAAGLLVVSQVQLARISRRVFSVPMLLAGVVLGGIAAWALIGVVTEQNALAAAHRDSDAVEVLSASRILLSRAQSDESLTLVGRGSDKTAPIDFAQVSRLLGSPSGLIAEAEAAMARIGVGDAGQVLSGEYASFSHAPRSPSTADRLNATLDGRIASAQRRFSADAADAISSLAGLSIAIPVLTLAATALALLGVRQRLEEYR